MGILTKDDIKKRTIGISDMVVSSDREEALITYSLGSCIAVIAYDPINYIAGMIHIMLPESKIEKLSRDSIAFNPYKYVDTGVPALFKSMNKKGSTKQNITVSVFGGAQVFDREDYFNIGKRNYVALRKLLWKHGMLIKNEHVGGKVHRTVKVRVNTGEITLDVNKEEIITYSSTRK